MKGSSSISGEDVIKGSHTASNRVKITKLNKFENWEKRLYAFLTERYSNVYR